MLNERQSAPVREDGFEAGNPARDSESFTIEHARVLPRPG